MVYQSISNETLENFEQTEKLNLTMIKTSLEWKNKLRFGFKSTSSCIIVTHHLNPKSVKPVQIGD